MREVAHPETIAGERRISHVDLAAQYAEERDDLLAVIDAVLAKGQYVGGAEIELLRSPLRTQVPVCFTLSGCGWSVASAAQGCRLGLGLFTAFWKFAADNPGLYCSCPFREKSRARFATGARWCQIIFFADKPLG